MKGQISFNYRGNFHADIYIHVHKLFILYAVDNLNLE